MAYYGKKKVIKKKKQGVKNPPKAPIPKKKLPPPAPVKPKRITKKKTGKKSYRRA